MAEQIQILREKLPFLGDNRLNAIAEESSCMELDAGVQLLREGPWRLRKNPGSR